MEIAYLCSFMIALQRFCANARHCPEPYIYHTKTLNIRIRIDRLVRQAIEMYSFQKQIDEIVLRYKMHKMNRARATLKNSKEMIGKELHE